MQLDPEAIRRGALRALLLAVPLTVGAVIVGQVADVDEGSSAVFLFLVLILLAFGAGGFEAGRHSSALPLTDGAVAAFTCWFVIQGIGTARRLIVGDDVSWVTLAFNGLLAVSAGLVGAALAARRSGEASPMTH